MGLIDAFEKEDRVNVKVSDLYRMLKEAAKAELIINGMKNGLSNCDMLKIVEVKKEEKE